MNLDETIQWEAGIYQIEETDLVLGGPVSQGGIANYQAQQLGNRTAFLHDLIGRYSNVVGVTLSASSALTAAQVLNNHIVVSQNSNVNGLQLTLPALSTLADGVIISLSISAETNNGGKNVKLSCSAGAVFRYRANNVYDDYNIILYSGEAIKIVKSGTTFVVLSAEANIYDVGEITHRYKKPILSVEAQGQLVSRVGFARLWAWLQIGGAGTVVSDSLWQSSINYSGCFSAGDGATTFRLPDLRSMFIRGLDNSRNLDLGRPYNSPGGYEADQLKAHTHTASGVVDQDNPDWVHNAGSGTNLYRGTVTTSSTGGAETTVKNIGYTAYIKY